MEKILLFLAFLVVYGLYLWTSGVLIKRYLNKIKKSSFWENELLIVVPYLFFFAFIFVIGKFFNANLLLLSILFSNIGLIIITIIWNLIGNPETPYKEIGGWTGGDFGAKNPWVILVSQGIILILLVAFPFVLGVQFFTVSDAATIRILTMKFSLILLLGSYILSLPIYIAVLTASFIDEDTRARYFLNQFSGVIAYSLFVSLLFHLFSWGDTEQLIELGSLSFSLSPKMFLILLGFIVLFLILPYFIGIQKAKRLKSDFLEINKCLLAKIIETVNLSTAQNLNEKIEYLENLLVTEYNKLVESDKGVALGVRYDAVNSAADVPQVEALQYQFYQQARKYDTRMVFYDFLNDTYQKLEELKTMNQAGGAEREEMIEKYVAHFQAYKEDLSKKEEAKGKANPALWIGIITVLSPLISQVMSVIGKYLIDVFKGV